MLGGKGGGGGGGGGMYMAYDPRHSWENSSSCSTIRGRHVHTESISFIDAHNGRTLLHICVQTPVICVIGRVACIAILKKLGALNLVTAHACVPLPRVTQKAVEVWIWGMSSRVRGVTVVRTGSGRCVHNATLVIETNNLAETSVKSLGCRT